MVLKKVRDIIRSISLLGMVILFSCEKQGLIVDCSNCTANEPLKVKLDINLDKNFYSAYTLINIYEGNLEDNVLYSTMNVSGTNVTVDVTPNKKYTATATYQNGDIQYLTVDSATPRIRFEKNQCNNPCYFVYDRSVNLRLRQH